MNDALREAARVDPEWAKKEARRQFILKVTVAGTLLALAIGAVSFVLSYHDAERITHVEQSACQVDAAGHECQQTKKESSRAASIATTCIPFFKAGYPCPKPGSTAAQRQDRRQAQAGSGSAGDLNSNRSRVGEGDASPTGEAPATPHHHGSTSPSTPHHPVSHPSPAPSPSRGEPAAAPEQTGSGSSAPASTETTTTPPTEGTPGTSEASSQGTVPKALEAAGEVVGSVQEEALTPTLCSVMGLLKPCP